MADASTIHTIGRRKESVCRLYIRPGSGKWDVNGRTLGDYFPRPALVSAIQQPFTATDTLGRYDVTASLQGGGQSGQAGALRPRRNSPERSHNCGRRDGRRSKRSRPAIGRSRCREYQK